MIKKLLLLILFAVTLISACQAVEQETLAELSTPILIQTKIPTQNILPTKTATSNPTNPPQIIFPTLAAKPSLTPIPSVTPGQRVTLMAVGDLMLGRTIGDLIENEGPEAPFRYVAETLSSADITVGNLECPISSRGVPEEKTYSFRAPIEAGESLAGAGFNLVSLANNHILDFGELAMADTLDILAANQIYAVGAGSNDVEAYAPIFITIDGLTLAFLAFADIPPAEYDYFAWEASPGKPGIAWAHEHRIREGVQAAKSQADIVIVLVHNGYEFVQKVSGYQQETARLAIESGATLVIGSHPHVLQRIEHYQEGVIFYSMGNFVFDNFLFPPNYSAILKVELSPQGVESYEMIDVVVGLDGVPQIMPYNLQE